MPEVHEIIGWLNLADRDYLAARVLIDMNLPLPATSLSSTAVEKYLKMVHRVNGWRIPSRGDPHNLLDLENSLKNNGLDLKLNKDYLSLLVKVYKFRYPDKIDSEYNFFLNQTKLMVGLDETVYKIRSRLRLVDDKGKEQKRSEFDLWIEQNDPRLVRVNHTFGKTSREDIFKNPSVCYEFRFVKGKAWLEAHYTAAVIDDEKYDLEGLRPGSNSDKEFNLQYASKET